MNEVIDLVQLTLDTLLANDCVYSFWGRRAEIDNDPQKTEYIIYSISDDSAEVSADGNVMFRMMTVGLNYYVKFAVARTYTGRKNALNRMDAIREAMRKAGFGCSGGWFEIGDVDEVGYATFHSEFDIPRLMETE